MPATGTPSRQMASVMSGWIDTAARAGIVNSAPNTWRTDHASPELVGRVVWHKKFGRGVVLQQEGNGDGAKCDVRFAGQFTRKIVAKFLTLEEGDDGFV